MAKETDKTLERGAVAFVSKEEFDRVESENMAMIRQYDSVTPDTAKRVGRANPHVLVSTRCGGRKPKVGDMPP